MGMSLKDSTAGMMKLEANAACRDLHGFIGVTGMQWAFLNKISALPQLMSLKATQEERAKKIVFDPLTSAGFQPYLPVDAFDSTLKSVSGSTQKTFNLDRQNAHFALPGYPLHSIGSNGIPTDCSDEKRTLLVSNHLIQSATSNPFVKIHGAISSPNNASISIKQQPIGGSLVAHTVGSDAPRPTPASTQLTIFYRGAVNVYDEVTPEQAQAIMSMAGNGSSMTTDAVNRPADLQPMSPKHLVTNGVHVNQPYETSPNSHLSIPVNQPYETSPNSHLSIPISISGSSNTGDFAAPRTIGASPEPPNKLTSIVSATRTLMPAAVPQARKASLARFLENRKERMMNANPYSKKSSDGAIGSDGASFASKLPTSIAQSW